MSRVAIRLHDVGLDASFRPKDDGPEIVHGKPHRYLRPNIRRWQRHIRMRRWRRHSRETTGH